MVDYIILLCIVGAAKHNITENDLVNDLEKLGELIPLLMLMYTIVI